MLYIVQIVFAGRAETPRIFLDRTGAEAAFVEQVKNRWKQSYSAFCDKNVIDMERFASARDFLDTLDMDERSQVNYWVVKPGDVDLAPMDRLEDFNRRRERLEKTGRQAARRADLVREELSGLLSDLSDLAECIGEAEHPPAEIKAFEPERKVASAPPAAEQKEPEGIPEKYTADGWKAFVGSVMTLCGGGRNESSLFTRHDWRQDVYGNATSLEYWDWVAAKVDRCRERAEKAGYSVIRDPDSPEDYKIRTPGGKLDETSFFSELDAWCQAAMNLPDEPSDSP